MSFIKIHLSRPDTSTQWGFRLEGGCDLGHPLNIKHVVPYSIAETCGLWPGDFVIQINGVETAWLRHVDAKMEIIRSGNKVDLLIQRRSSGTAPWYYPSKIYYPSYTTPLSVNVHSSGPLAPVSAPTGSRIYSSEGKMPMVVHNAGIHKASTLGDNSSSSCFVVRRPAEQYPPAYRQPQTMIMPSFDTGTNQKFFYPYSRQHSTQMQVNLPANYQRNVSFLDNEISSGTQSLRRWPKSHDYSVHSHNYYYDDFSRGQGYPYSHNLNLPYLNGSNSVYCGVCGDAIHGVIVKSQNCSPLHPECFKCCRCGISLQLADFEYISGKLYCRAHAEQLPYLIPQMKLRALGIAA